MIIADSSFLVALFMPNDKNYDEAKRGFAQVKDRIFVSNIILYETLTVINYKATAEEKRTVYDKIMSNKIFMINNLNETELEEILFDFLSYSNKLSFEDVSVIYLAKKSNSEVLAFDGGIHTAIK